ncbi:MULTISPECIES: fibronectin type III domain-containing protein [Sphingobium]|uniref:fibronectin type III domain-containing protein n=1 Tax=Sphingobium sp. MI1205 TaxID=407020 RepID=UPI00076FE76B|nr:fibronectin type III domain-containing protein [Sphingobium sp. MI1205]AMK16581.1 putative hydrolase [Sphingobium sp. MI1205]
MPHSPGQPYAARNLPDRIVLTPGADPVREMAVAWRTDGSQAAVEAQIAPAIDGPSLEARAKLVTGTSSAITTQNGQARYHQARFTGLNCVTMRAANCSRTSHATSLIRRRRPSVSLPLIMASCSKS